MLSWLLLEITVVFVFASKLRPFFLFVALFFFFSLSSSSSFFFFCFLKLNCSSFFSAEDIFAFLFVSSHCAVEGSNQIKCKFARSKSDNLPLRMCHVSRHGKFRKYFPKQSASTLFLFSIFAMFKLMLISEKGLSGHSWEPIVALMS